MAHETASPAAEIVGMRLARTDLPRDTMALAKFLIGKRLVHEVNGDVLAGRIVETEAYTEDDAASHSFRGQTQRNRSMFLRRGHAYVYIAYGCWPALNVVGDEAGVGAAVLLRALEPLSGLEAMQAARDTARPRDLARGPGRLGVAMGISLAEDGVDLCGEGPLYLAGTTEEPPAIATTARIGITKDADLPRRFFDENSNFVSGSRRLARY